MLPPAGAVAGVLAAPRPGPDYGAESNILASLIYHD
jgi:hypothetical protein